jgi:chromosome segregation ATPase
MPALSFADDTDDYDDEPDFADQPTMDRLEEEIQALQAKWLDIEHELGQRDRRIEQLEAALETSAAMLQTVEGRLRDATAERESAMAEIAGLRAELQQAIGIAEARQRELREKGQGLEQLEKAAQKHDVQLNEREEALGHLREKIAEQERTSIEVEQVSKALGAENEQLHISLQDLRSYVDGRRPEWDRLNLELARQQQTLKGVEAALSAKEKLLHRHNLERGALRDRIRELESRCEEFAASRDALASEESSWRVTAEHTTRELADAHRAEEELREEIARLSVRAALVDKMSAALEDAEEAKKELTAALDDAQARLAQLTDELHARDEQASALEDQLAGHVRGEDEAHKARADVEERAAELEIALAERAAGAQNLEEDLAARNSEIQSLREELLAIRHRVDEADDELATGAARVEELEAAGIRDAQALESTRTELAALADQRDALGAELTAREQLIGDLQDQVSALETDRERLSQDLTKQAEIIRGLEDELREKLENINHLSRSVDRLASIEANIRKLDESMSHRTEGRQAEAASNVTRLMIAMTGDRAVKYPISKDTVTIGRAPNSDIQIKRQYISRHHARIVSDRDGTVIEDLNSKNGILVNARRVQRQRLHNGDTVDIGKVQFKFIDLLEEHAGEGNA